MSCDRYTSSDIIELAEDERLQNLIGKKVYASWSKEACLYMANHNWIDLQYYFDGVTGTEDSTLFIVHPCVLRSQPLTNSPTSHFRFNMSYIIEVKN